MIVVAFVVAAAAGTIARWKLGEVLPSPMGTLLVNLVGAFLLGWLIGESTVSDTVLGVAALGSLTTYSTLMVEVVGLWSTRPRHAVGYLAVTFGGGVGLAWLGLTLG